MVGKARGLALFSLVSLLGLTTCRPKGPPRVDEVDGTRTLEPSAEVVTRRASAPFAVVFGAPRGETTHAVEVSLLFNRPMRPLETAGEESAPPARISVAGGASPAGTWRWLGTSALRFAPKERLAAATEYEVTVPAGTRSLADDVLGLAYTLRFSTMRPRVERLDPRDGSDQLLPAQTFEARFDQPVDAREVERATTLWLGEGAAERKVPLHAVRPDAGNPKLVRLTPAAPLPLATSVRVTFDESLKGLEGPLPMSASQSFEMSTYGPLLVSKVSCGDADSPTKCRSNTSLEIDLANAVPLGELKSHLRVEPAAKLEWDSTEDPGDPQSEFEPSVHFRPGTRYLVTVSAGMHDRYGQTLARDLTVPIDVMDIDPAEDVGVRGSVVEAAPARPLVVPVRSVNLDAYELAVGALDEPQLTSLALHPWLGSPSERLAYAKDIRGARFETVLPQAPRNVPFLKTVDVGALLASTGGRGAAFLATASGLQTVNVTDLAISAQMSRFGSLVWVTR
ncbi:MAG: Ig-like domain-containing protein, partial [Polyangiaceae bacterium]